MTIKLKDYIVNLENVEPEDILPPWKWLIDEVKALLVITRLGDLFFLGEDDVVYWLQTDVGDVTDVADSLDEFHELLTDEETVEEWFLTPLLEALEAAGKKLKENEVYSYKLLPVLGGEYEVANIEPTKIKVHFEVTGVICEQIQGLPDGTEVEIKVGD